MSFQVIVAKDKKYCPTCSTDEFNLGLLFKDGERFNLKCKNGHMTATPSEWVQRIIPQKEDKNATLVTATSISR